MGKEKSGLEPSHAPTPPEIDRWEPPTLEEQQQKPPVTTETIDIALVIALGEEFREFVDQETATKADMGAANQLITGISRGHIPVMLALCKHIASR